MNLCANNIMIGISAHQRFKTEPIKAYILLSLLLVSILHISSKTIWPVVLFDRAANSYTITLIDNDMDGNNSYVLLHMGCKDLLDNKILPQPKFEGVDYYAKNFTIMDALGYTTAQKRGGQHRQCARTACPGNTCATTWTSFWCSILTNWMLA